jgi:DNA-binding NarL/FixJ family response regulator
MLRITPWERAALGLLASGTSTEELARRLGLERAEVEARLTALFGRMGAASRTDAVAVACRRGLLYAERPRPASPAAPVRGASPL